MRLALFIGVGGIQKLNQNLPLVGAPVLKCTEGREGCRHEQRRSSLEITATSVIEECSMHLSGTQARPRLHCNGVPLVLEENISFMQLIEMERMTGQKKACRAVAK